MDGPACVILPESKSVLMVIFCCASRVPAGSKSRCPGRETVGRHVAVCVESRIAGQGDLEPVFPGADEHPMSSAAEFADGSGKSVVHKNGGSLRCDLQLDL